MPAEPSPAPSPAAARPWPALLPTAEAARYCGSSTPAWRKDDHAGRVPAPLHRGRRLLWRRADLDAWINAGCPPRDADAAAAYAAATRGKLDGLARARG